MTLVELSACRGGGFDFTGALYCTMGWNLCSATVKVHLRYSAQLTQLLCLLRWCAEFHQCPYCPSSYTSAADLQQHLCAQHFSQEGELFGCAHCELLFPSQLELQGHFLSHHTEALSDESQVSATQMVTHHPIFVASLASVPSSFLKCFWDSREC